MGPKPVMGDRMMMVMYRMAKNQAWPEEGHEAEQGGYILQGGIELSLSARGEKH